MTAEKAKAPKKAAWLISLPTVIGRQVCECCFTPLIPSCLKHNQGLSNPFTTRYCKTFHRSYRNQGLSYYNHWQGSLLMSPFVAQQWISTLLPCHIWALVIRVLNYLFCHWPPNFFCRWCGNDGSVDHMFIIANHMGKLLIYCMSWNWSVQPYSVKLAYRVYMDICMNRNWIDHVCLIYSEIAILHHEFQVHIVASHSGVVLVS
jgi:hypothetical protein